MKIKLMADLGVPFDMRFSGGKNPAIFKFFGEVDVDITADALGDIIDSKLVVIKVAEVFVSLYRYKRKHQMFYGSGQLDSIEQGRIQVLVRAGWIPDPLALRHYRIRLK